MYPVYAYCSNDAGFLGCERAAPSCLMRLPTRPFPGCFQLTLPSGKLQPHAGKTACRLIDDGSWPAKSEAADMS